MCNRRLTSPERQKGSYWVRIIVKIIRVTSVWRQSASLFICTSVCVCIYVCLYVSLGVTRMSRYVTKYCPWCGDWLEIGYWSLRRSQLPLCCCDYFAARTDVGWAGPSSVYDIIVNLLLISSSTHGSHRRHKLQQQQNWQPRLTAVNCSIVDECFASHKGIPLHTRSSAVAERPRDASCLSVVSINSTTPRAHSFIINYFGFRFTAAYNVQLSSRKVETSCHKHFVVRLPRTTNDAAYCYQRRVSPTCHGSAQLYV